MSLLKPLAFAFGLIVLHDIAKANRRNDELVHEEIPDMSMNLDADYLQYPEEAIENRIGCNVETIFYVSPQGEIKRFSAKSSNDETLVAEAKRVLSTFEKWPIALYKGKPTYLYFGMPINFEIR